MYRRNTFVNVVIGEQTYTGLVLKVSDDRRSLYIRTPAGKAWFTRDQISRFDPQIRCRHDAYTVC